MDKHNIEILFMSKFGHMSNEDAHREIMEFYTPNKVYRNIFNVQCNFYWSVKLYNAV